VKVAGRWARERFPKSWRKKQEFAADGTRIFADSFAALARNDCPSGQEYENSFMREIVTLQCGQCKDRNYSTTKNKKTTTERLEFNKFCRKCRKHTPHKEVK
jgi:large subunit ribosomal protein L33